MFKRKKHEVIGTIVDPVEIKFSREMEKEMLVAEAREMRTQKEQTQALREAVTKPKPRTAADVIAATVENHKDSMKKNHEYITGCANKVSGHLQEVERLNEEIADIQRLNDALQSMVLQLTVTEDNTPLEPEDKRLQEPTGGWSPAKREFLGEDHTAKQEAKTKVSREMLDNTMELQDDERDEPPKGGE